MARPLRVQFEGAVYHLIVRSINRQPLFRDKEDRQRYLDLLSRYQSRFGFKVYCYFLVSRQIHLLLETPKGNISKVMQGLGTSYTAYFNRRHKRHGALFEGRYKSHLIENERYLPEATRYIHRSCFKSSVATNKLRNYAWSSYRIYLGKKFSDLVNTAPVLTRFGQVLSEQRKRYQEFVESVGGKEGSRQEPDYLKYFGRHLASARASSAKSEVADPAQTENSLKIAERILREVSLSMAGSEIAELRPRNSRALARHITMYLIRKQTGLPLRLIGELLGVKASAVALGIVKVEQLLKRGDCSPKVKSLLDNNTFPPLGVEDDREFNNTTPTDGGPFA